MYYPYGFIGFRKGCTTCPFYWTDSQPTQYTNWYGSDPNTYYYECTEMYITTTYNGKWLDYTCNGAINAFCQFYPRLQQPPVVPQVKSTSAKGQNLIFNIANVFYLKLFQVTLPPMGGCKDGWWPFAGYCYKPIGFTGQFWEQDEAGLLL